MDPFIDRLTRWLRFNFMYLRRPPWDTGITPPELEDFIRTHPPGQAIDLGCGTGTNLVRLGKAGWEVTGVDFAMQAVRSARLRLKREKIPGEVRNGDVSRYEVVRGKYQLVLDIGCYHGLPRSSRVDYRENLNRILVGGGWFLLYAHWAKEGQPSGSGIAEEDFNELCTQLILEDRQDSYDRWGRSAAWMRFRKREG